MYYFFSKLVFVSLMMGGILQWIYGLLILNIISGTLVSNLTICIILGIIFLILLFIMGQVFRIKEILTLYEKIFRRIFPWQKNVISKTKP